MTLQRRCGKIDTGNGRGWNGFRSSNSNLSDPSFQIKLIFAIDLAGRALAPCVAMMCPFGGVFS